jgi:hypothetical protein
MEEPRARVIGGEAERTQSAMRHLVACFNVPNRNVVTSIANVDDITTGRVGVVVSGLTSTANDVEDVTVPVDRVSHASIDIVLEHTSGMGEGLPPHQQAARVE